MSRNLNEDSELSSRHPDAEDVAEGQHHSINLSVAAECPDSKRHLKAPKD